MTQPVRTVIEAALLAAAATLLTAAAQSDDRPRIAAAWGKAHWEVSGRPVQERVPLGSSPPVQAATSPLQQG
ncbi:hypothetical protein SAMN06297144_2509 [Sphingomonas guangdongensis]|uniref:Uncharacterized protein n=1 Tax=Sphingomonas guangdongensis TaxID=1141890 RepID=A0A285R4V1_9SPHN|nr:hypothetical protein [Sphingomonas guangdongensis]SOB87377.1 hypothetical protein SAMN06297144_2509 [Sphingomonas guangdongensis]